MQLTIRFRSSPEGTCPRVPFPFGVRIKLGNRHAGQLYGDNLPKLNRGLWLAISVCLPMAVLWAADIKPGDIRPDVRSLATAVDAHYNHLRTLQAEFTEVYRGAGMERTESGTLWLKKPGKMRWEYRSPREKVFVSNGKDAWLYVPDDRQARKEAAKKLDDVRSPLAFLLGKTKLQKELRGLSLAPDIEPLSAGNKVLRGVPAAFADRISEIILEIAPDSRIVRLEMQGVDGAVTEYRFMDQREDLAIADSRFDFRPPAGTEVIEGELGQ